MGAEDQDPPPARLRPTVMPVAPRPPAATRPAPTLMPGSAPLRLTVETERLVRLAPTAGPEALAAAHSLLAALIPAHLTDRHALFWAQDLQEAHAQLVQDRLALLRDPLLREIPTHLDRLRDLLSRLDLGALCRPGGLWTGVFRKTSRVIDTPGELQAARAEMDHLLRLLAGALEPLVDLKARLDQGAARMQPLAHKIEAASLAAAYLAETAAPHLTRAFQERRTSLSTSLVQIRTAEAQHVLHTALPARLVVAIQNLVLVALPAWLERLSQFQGKLESGRSPSLTEARDLGFRLADLMPLFPQPE